jgi:hypothetical protein
MEQKRWIRVKLESPKVKHQQNVRGLDLTMYVSPYDVPEAVRGSYDNEKKRFVVEFKYIGDETTETEKNSSDRFVKLIVGKNSRRLYGIEIDVDSLRATQVKIEVGVQQEVAHALDGLVNRPPNRQRLDNYQLAREAFTSTSPELFAAFA